MFIEWIAKRQRDLDCVLRESFSLSLSDPLLPDCHSGAGLNNHSAFCAGGHKSAVVRAPD